MVFFDGFDNGKFVAVKLIIEPKRYDIKAKNYSLSAGQYFDVKIDYVDITADEFNAKMKGFSDTLNSLFKQSHELEGKIKKRLEGLKFNS